MKSENLMVSSVIGDQRGAKDRECRRRLVKTKSKDIEKTVAMTALRAGRWKRRDYIPGYTHFGRVFRYSQGLIGAENRCKIKR